MVNGIFLCAPILCGTSWNWNRVIGRRRGVVAVNDGGGDAAVDTVVNSLLNLQWHQAELSCLGAHLAMTSFLYIDWWRQLLRCKVKDICSAIWRNFSAAGSRHALPNKSKVRWWVWMMIRGVSVINWLSEKSEFCENPFDLIPKRWTASYRCYSLYIHKRIGSGRPLYGKQKAAGLGGIPAKVYTRKLLFHIWLNLLLTGAFAVAWKATFSLPVQKCRGLRWLAKQKKIVGCRLYIEHESIPLHNQQVFKKLIRE